MFKKYTFGILIFCFALLSDGCNFDAFAGHRPGGTFSWRCIGPNTYEITFKRITTCDKTLPDDVDICIIGSLPGDINNRTYDVDSAYSIPHPVRFCDGTSTCCGGCYNWPTEIFYIDTIVLTPYSPSYKLYYCDGGNRPSANNGSSSGFYIEATFDTTAPCNSSAVPTNFRNTFYCIGDTSCIINDYVDPDGDSLSIYLGNCMNFTYTNPFTGAAPMSSTIGWLVDSSTGNVCFLPPGAQTGYICLIVEEWRAGVKIAQNINENYIYVIDCDILSDTGVYYSAVSFDVDLTGNPDTAWISPPVQRDGSVCGAACNENCIEFIVTLDTAAEAVIVDIISGCIPAGALTWSINCGPTYSIGQKACVAGAGPHRIAFCKPGGCTNEYRITSIEKVVVYTDLTVSEGCTSDTIYATGFYESTITWNSIYPDTFGTYNSYLSCTAGCDSVLITAPPTNHPLFVDFEFCGQAVQGCDSIFLVICDTFRVFFVDTLIVKILPDTSPVCYEGSPLTFTASGTGGAPPYSYLWNTGDTTESITVTVPDIYWVTISDTSSTSNCSPDVGAFRTASVVVAGFPAPVIITTGNDTSICYGATAQLSGNLQIDTSAFDLTFFNPVSYAIPNNDHNSNNYSTTKGVSSSIDVSGSCYNTVFTGFIESVCINIEHGSDAELDIFLACPGGTWIQLSTDNGGSGDNYSNTCFTPTASTNIDDGSASAPFTGNYLPEGSFTGLNGCAVNGTWILNVQDDGGNTTGTLLNWSITFSNDSCIFIDYGWTPGSTLNNDTIFNPLATPDTTTDYVFFVQDEFGCKTETDTQRVTVYPPIVLLMSQVNLSCFGDSSGSAVVSASGGSGSFTYSWNTSPVQTTATATGLDTGTYTVTVTDALGCDSTASVTITQPPLLIANITDSVYVTCNGAGNGSATVTASGGTLSYTYSWSPAGGTAAAASGLSGGIYTITVTDSKGCVAKDSVNIYEPAILGIDSIIKTNISCNGANDGLATVYPSGGTLPYTYLWNSTPFQTTQTAAGLRPGSYCITVTDSNGCDTTSCITITEPSLLSGSITYTRNVSCNGAGDGELTVTPSGGTVPYTYSWAPSGGTDSAATGLVPDTYTVTVTDSRGCTISVSATIFQPAVLSIDSIKTTNLSCYGVCNGTATVYVSGGVPPRTYAWTPGTQTTTTATGLCAGAYTITVTDANGCVNDSTVTITQPPELFATITSVTPVSCFGGSDGQATATPVGGTPPFSFLWIKIPNDTIDTNQTATFLSPGFYTVKITDANSCYKSTSVIITQPTQISLSFTTVNASCGICNGKAYVTASGGTPYQTGTPYVYFWSTLPPNDADSIVDRCPGCYDVIVLDSNGCAATGTACIINIDVVLEMDPDSVTCYGGCDGQATVRDTLITPPYTYLWNDGAAQTNATAIGLCAGTYTATVTNGNGCEASKSVTILQPSPIVSGISKIDVACNGNCTGQATAIVSGEHPPYTYSWSPSGGTGSTATGLCAITYTVTVTDGLGCDTTISVIITEPPLLTATITDTVNITCKGANNGSATVTVSGGVTVYTYSWNSTPVQTTAIATGLPPGCYTVTVTDANGCDTTASVCITEPPLLVVDGTNVVNISCNGLCDGQASVTVSGGTPGYDYSWNTLPIQTTATATGLCPGTYIVTITDTNGCDTSASVTITQPTLLTGSITAFTYVSCFGFNDGSATVTPSGGTPPYTYLWNDGLSQTGSMAINLYADTFNVIITDANGCNITKTVIIIQPALLIIDTIAVTNISCYGAADGVAAVTAGGGTPGYTYSWNSSPAQTTATATGLPPGIYCITVTDNNGCDTTACITITQPDLLVAAISSFVNVACNGDSTAWATVTTSGGTTPYTYSWTTTPVQTTATANGLPIGSYTVNVTDANGCDTLANITITEPPPLTDTISSIINVSCNGANDGQATVTVAGGALPYTYNWNTTPVQATPTADSLAPQVWKITVTDNNGCVVVDSVTITQPFILTSSITSTIHINCFGDSTGMLAVTPAGGTLPYTYSWNTTPVQTTDTASALTVGTWCVDVTDANACTTSVCGAISQPAAPLSAVITDSSNVICYGEWNGSATVFASGGTFTYTYSWNDLLLQTTTTATGLSARCYYTVTVTDNKGCVAKDSVCISQPPPFTAAITAVKNATCFDSCNGEATVTASGGTAPYNYIWYIGPNQYTPTATGLCATSYTVDLWDTNGCYATSSVIITRPKLLEPSISSITHVSCFGGNDGALTVIPSSEMGEPAGGTPPYTYLWSNADTSTTTDSLFAGTYTVTVTDSNGCSASVSATVNEPTLLTAGKIINSQVLCFGSNEGNATVIAGGGAPPYTYSWNSIPVQTTDTASGLTAGTYIATVTDTNGCDTSVSVTITEPLLLIADITDSSDVSCNGANDGSATVTASGGTPAYTYLWNDIKSQTTALADSLAPGCYTVTVTDVNGCDTTASVCITEPAVLLASITGSTNISCNGANDGSASMSASGGTLPYTYSWSSVPVQTTTTAGSLAPGDYCVTVTDSNGCSDTACVTITQPLILTASISSITDVKCFGDSTGATSVAAAGGTTPYTYSWNSVPVQTADTATGLPAGTYTVIVTDANGCKDTVDATINQPPVLTAGITDTTMVSCFGGNDGKATVSASGGTMLYTYSWNCVPVQTTPEATGLPAGCYIVTITDANGCDTTASVCITEPTLFTASITAVTNVACFGLCNGSATVTPSGGTPGYIYVWSTAPIQVTPTATGLCATFYTVNLWDAKGCPATASVTITQPDTLVASISSITHVSCFGGDDGALTVIHSGGTPPYTYLWDDGFAQTTATAYTLIAGTYSVTVTDSNGCSSTVSATVNEPALLIAGKVINSQVLCFGSNEGNATVIAGGGAPPYTYSWNSIPVQTTDTASGLTAGTYIATVTDTNGCDTSVSVTITEPPLLIAWITDSVNVSCNGFNDGSATVTASGGTPAYTYLWNDPDSQTTAAADSLPPGCYTVTVTDINGCDTTASICITQPAILSASITGSTNISCNGANDGTATGDASGGTLPYAYSWSSVPVQTTAAAGSLAPGDYCVTVTDANGCSDTACVTITQPLILTAGITSITNVNCFGDSTGSVTASASGGTSPYTYLWDDYLSQTTITATGLDTGNYTVTVTDANGCVTTASATITQPAAPLTANITDSTNVSCFGGNDGEATVTASGGTMPYTYVWNDGFAQTTANATGLTAGCYAVTVTDANGCDTTASVCLTEPPVLDASVTLSTYISCNGGAGQATLIVTGGTPAYTYLWSNGDTDTLSTGLKAGTYTVIVTDAMGCQDSAVITLNEPNPMLMSVADDSSDCGAATGKASVSVLGGVPPYTYVWVDTIPPGVGDTISNNDTITGVPAGIYYAIVTDSIGCEQTIGATVSDRGPFIIGRTIVNVSCNGFNDGSVIITLSGATPPYTYEWKPPVTSTDSIADSLVAGTYYVTVTDAIGCKVSATATVIQPFPIIDAIAIINVSCNGGNNGLATVTVSNQYPPYTHIWSNGDNTFMADTLSAGTYTDTITDATGCDTVLTVVITEPNILVTNITDSSHITCFGFNDGSATLTTSGGTAPYTYSWNTTPLQTTGIAGSLLPGTWTATVTDALGCVTSDSVLILEPTLLTDTISSLTNVSCNGAGDGTATVTPSGGMTPYTYSWNPTPQTDSTAINLIPGKYFVTTIDSNGCFITDSVTITEPPVLTVSIASIVHVSCFGGSDGSVAITTGGGTLPYTYSWNSSPIQTTDTAVGLDTGIYTVIVTDTNGCTVSVSATVNQPALLTANMTDSTMVSCFGYNNGSATVTAAGGTLPYTYLWNDGQTTSTAVGLIAGCYTVIVTDAKGCDTTAGICITEPPLLTAFISSINISCNGFDDGSATVTVGGGTLPYSYVWTPISGQFDSFIDSLTPDTHTVFVTDSLGCDTAVSVIITQPDTLIVTITNVINVSCYSDSTGTATASVTGGTTPYTYSWSTTPLQTDSIATGLPVGTYTVTVTDTQGCVTTKNKTITQPDSLIAIISSSTDDTCYADSNGSATLTTSGGAPPYAYSWNSIPVQTTAIANGLPAGNYTVTVTDSLGCYDTANVIISQPDTMVATITGVTNASCKDVCDGSITVAGTGGNPPIYFYSWSTMPVQTSATATGLCDSVYTVTLTDVLGCIATADTVITEPAVLTANMTNIVNVSCNGVCDGEATLATTGGTTPYSYSWNPPPSPDTVTATGLCAGLHTGFVTDVNGCFASDTVTITQPPVLTVSIGAISHVKCFGGSDGSVPSVTGGGTLPYTYSWNSVPPQTTDTAFGLDTGIYTVTVTDFNGCIVTVSATVNQPALLTASITDSAYVTCFGFNNGSATVTPAGGMWPYTYLWNDLGFQTTSTAVGLIAGCYTVIVTDANGCDTTASICITEPPVLTASISSVNISCNGFDDGQATVTVGGGTLPYSYVWTPMPGEFTPVIDSLTPDTHTVFVTDSQDCKIDVSVIITQPDILLITITNVINVSCYSDSTGEATASVTGGTTPYTYSWNTPPPQTDSVATGLPVGTYTVTVTDTQGCVTTKSKTITQPDTLIATISSFTDAACYLDSNGQATVSVSGGASPYIYLWSSTPLQTAATANGLPAGNYTVTVTDTLGCVNTANVLISQPDTMVATITNVTNVSCNGLCDGTATVVRSGGNPPPWLNGYSWNTPGGVQTTPTATGLCPGAYTVTILDLKECMATADAVITEPPVLEVSITNVKNVSCNGACDGEATLTPTGGTQPYSYSWNSFPTQDSVTATGLCADPVPYTGTVTDTNGCVANDNVTITEPPVLTANIDSLVHVRCNGAKDGSASLTTSGGTPPYTYSWNSIPVQTDSVATGLDTGTYTAVVTDTKGCTYSVGVTINQPAVLITYIKDSTMVSCFGGNDGWAEDTAYGGMPPYAYLWNDPDSQPKDTAGWLYAGVYTVIVTDGNGCDTTASVTITEPPLLVATISGSRDVYCKDDSTGMAVVSVTGGTLPYTYLWDDSGPQVADTAVGLPDATYTVTVTDSLGCDTTATVTITEPEYLVGVISYIKNVYCKGDSTAEANVSVEGGTPPYTYLWNDWNGQTDTLATGLDTGIYTVIITDTLGCDTNVSVTITEPDTLAATITAIRHVYCNGDSTGIATATPTGGTPPYTYSWNTIPVQTDSMAVGLWAGTHVYTITDTLGCVFTDSVVITEQTPIVITMVDTIVVCVGQSVSISASATGGVPQLTYSWNDTLGTGQGPFIIYPKDSIYYVVTVKDSLNCIMKDSTYVDVHPLIVTFTVDDSLCIGDSIQICVSMTGGDGNYSIFWPLPANGDTTKCIMVVPAASTWYSIVVTDGCGTPAAFDSVFVEVNPYPEISIFPQDAFGCQFASFIFMDEFHDPPNSRYVWVYGDGNVSDTIQTIYTTIHAYDTVGIFYVNLWAMTTKGCAKWASTPATVIISEFPVSDFTAIASEVSMLTTEFYDLSTGDSIVRWRWNFGDGYSIDNGWTGAVNIPVGTNDYLTTGTYQNPVHTYTDTGVYTVKLITENVSRCADTVSKVIISCANFLTGSDTIVMSRFPDANFALKGRIPFPGTPLETTVLFPVIWFEDRTAVADSIVNWFWEFGDGNTDTIQNPIHEYDTAGSEDCNYCYEIQLTVRNKYGCPDTTSKLVIVKPAFRVWIPNAFSPNGDGTNDVFFIKGIYIVDFEMFIFDRWGMQIFKTFDLNIPWDGTINNGTEIAQMDVYVYMINIVDIFGEEHQFVGHVSLIK